ncbi:MAG TPA: hypothetical protein VEA80_10095 [Vitreimonas sp.]|uniref:hypothetical protein n=1 Tax=Vitreimonas sp. TaxID=3069702 RepID=UPI002D440982|nr:hypothetical protein [Vitreimonas sp.]HYD87815.1 hypothetical protein [Vitreimonas sp.]
MLRLALTMLFTVLASAPAFAQPVFANPFADAPTYRAERGSLTEASYRVRYEATYSERGATPVVRELVMDVAPDWSLVRDGAVTRLYDFKLNRVFVIYGDSFSTMNGLADVTFRVMERQNRTYLARVMSAAGARGDLADACDAESELGLAIPGSTDAGATEIRERAGAFSLRCAGREVGGFTPGDGAAAPAAFWPTMYAVMITHPALHQRVRDTGRAPAQMEITYREAPGPLTRRAWRLVAVETVSTPYPLDAALRNETAATIDQLAPGAGAAGAEAVAGRAQGGAPTLQSWDHHLRTVSRRDGEAAAAMLIGLTYNMFPELQCDAGQPHFVCDLVRRVRSLEDRGPWSQLEVAIAEQQRNPAAAIAAMQSAQNSRHRDHPALGATFALALSQFNQDQLAQARAAGLPTDIAALQNRALIAFPYNPAYWTDVGDRFGYNYEWPSAFLFYDVAYSLPMPSALERNQALVDKRAQMQRIRRDFPDATLSLTP